MGRIRDFIGTRGSPSWVCSGVASGARRAREAVVTGLRINLKARSSSFAPTALTEDREDGAITAVLPFSRAVKRGGLSSEASRTRDELLRREFTSPESDSCSIGEYFGLDTLVMRGSRCSDRGFKSGG